jgi:hypothetical protein
LFSVYFIARLLTSMYVLKNKHKENLIWWKKNKYLLINFINYLI